MWFVDPVYAYDYTREAERYLKFCARLKKFEIKARLRFDMNLTYLTSFVYFDEDEGDARAVRSLFSETRAKKCASQRLEGMKTDLNFSNKFLNS